MRTDSPRSKWHRRRRHIVARRQARPLRREKNLNVVSPSWEVNRQYGDAGVRLVCLARRQGWIVRVTNRLGCRESGSTWWVNDLDLHILRSDSQICRGSIQVDRRVCVHSPLDRLRCRYLVLQQDLCPFVQHPDATGEGGPASPPNVKTCST